MDAADDIVRDALAADVVLQLVDGRLGYIAKHGALPPALRERIVTSKDAIIDFLKRAAPVQIVPVDRSGALPLSFGQQRLWFIDQLEGGSRQYNVSNMLELTGRLDRAALQRTFDAIVQRHEVLRTTYERGPEGPVQIVRAARPVTIEDVDVSLLDAEQRDAEIERISEQVAGCSFELCRDSMLRLALLRIAPERHVLITAMHHIVSDGWSLAIMVKEFTAIYSALCRGQPHGLPALPLQYGDFACWQRNTFTHEQLAGQLRYWRERLCAVPSIHALPTDRPRAARQTFVGHSHSVSIEDPHCLRLLNETAARTGATLFMILLSAYSVLLARWSNRRTIALGTPIAGRTHEQLEPLLGIFLNSLVLALEVRLEATFEELLVQARQHALDAYANQDIPFEMLVDKLQPRRSLSHSPLFQIMFTLQNTEPVSFELAELSIQPVASRRNIVKFDIEFVVGSDARGLWLTWNYAQALFDAATIQAMAGSFEVLLRGLLQQPEVPLHRVPLVPRAELASSVRRPPGAAVLPSTPTVMERFAAQVHATPHAVALCAGNVRWTYATLHEQMMRLAVDFAAAELGPGARALVLLENTPIRFAVLLALLTRGVAALTVEPASLRESVAELVAGGGIGCVLTEPAHASAVRDVPAGVRVLNVLELGLATGGTPWLPRLALSSATVAVLVAAEPRADRHECIALTHASLIAHAERRRELAQGVALGPSSRTLLLPGACHFAPLEWLLPLLAGAQLHLMSVAECASLECLSEYLPQARITHLTLPAALLPHLPAMGEHRLQHLVLTGERVPEATAWRWARACRVASVCGVPALPAACVAAVEPDRPLFYAPGAGIEVRILDSYQNALPAGAVGEVHVSCTADAARQLTATSHATGMLGRQHPGGGIELLGAVGDELGYEDFGVPLASVEKYLSRCPALANVVLDCRDPLAARGLTAYAIPAAAPLDTHAIDELLKANWPDYMIPEKWIWVDELPVTVHGQVDRQALIRRQQRDRSPAAEMELPRLRTDRACKTLGAARIQKMDLQLGRAAGGAAAQLAAMSNVSLRESLLGMYVLLMMVHNGSSAACVEASNLRERQRGYLPGRRLVQDSLTLACQLDSEVEVVALLRQVADVVRGRNGAAPCAGSSACLTDHPAQTRLLYARAAADQLPPTQLALQLVLADSAEQISGCWLYDADVFDTKTITQLSTTYRSLLEWVSADSRTTAAALKARLLAGTRATIHRLKGRFAAR